MAVKKQWYEIISPKLFGSKVIGETPASDVKALVGRKVGVSFAELSGDFSKYYLRANLRVESVNGDKALTAFVGHEIMRERLYRMVQRRAKKVDAIQDCKTKDGAKLRVKTVAIIRTKGGASVKSAVRKKMKETVDAIVKENTLDQIATMIFSGEFPQKIRQECKKISPVSAVEVRRTQLITEKEKTETKE